jgi:hypothetical protein
MSGFSEWLEIMLGEIARKRDEAARALAEQQQREREAAAAAPSGTTPADSDPASARFSVRVSRAF